MRDKVEKFLRKSMFLAGTTVEKVIGQAQKAKKQMGNAPHVEPIIALESQLAASKLRELLQLSVTRVITPLVPNLVDKSALELVEGEALLAPNLKEKGAAIAMHVDVGRSAGSYPQEEKSPLHHLQADVKQLPFEDGFFDFVLANMATPQQGDILKVIQETSRIVTLGGKTILIDYHPFGHYAKRGNVRLRTVTKRVKGVEDYYKLARGSGFAVDYIKETFFDETMRGQFVTPEEKTAFRAIKSSPFLIYLLLTKKGPLRS